MGWEKDITGVDEEKEGTFRSLNGAADENIFIGRASKAGFYCFFKVWRDMPYDAVLDYKGILYRVEVKGSSKKSFNVTRGTRSGQQIKKDTSRTRVLSREDCDFVVGVNSNNGDCYIIPEDIVEAIGLKNLSQDTLENYKEKWGLFIYKVNGLSKKHTRDGLYSLEMKDLKKMAKALDIDIPDGDYQVPGTKTKISDKKKKIVYLIWEELAKRL